MKNNQKVYKPNSQNDSLIDRIRKGGGTIFVDPAPMSKPLEECITMLCKIFGKKR